MNDIPRGIFAVLASSLACGDALAISCSTYALEVLEKDRDFTSSQRYSHSAEACLAAARFLPGEKDWTELELIKIVVDAQIDKIRLAANEILARAVPDLNNNPDHTFVVSTTNALFALATLIEDDMPDADVRERMTKDLNRYVAHLCASPGAKPVFEAGVRNAMHVSDAVKERVAALFAAPRPGN